MATTRKAAVKSAARRPPARKKPAATKSPARRPAARKPADRGVAGEIVRLAGVGTDAVAKATGKAWDQWLAILDGAGAAALPHKAIAALLAGRHRVPPWWSQMVAVGYEQARGLRKPHQKADGFSASASRTVAAGLDRLYGAWADPKLRTLWLRDAPIQVRRATDGKSLRITWTAGGSSVAVNFFPVAGGRSRVQVEHGRLADAAARSEQKAFWSAALDRLKAMLEKAA